METLPTETEEPSAEHDVLNQGFLEAYQLDLFPELLPKDLETQDE